MSLLAAGMLGAKNPISLTNWSAIGYDAPGTTSGTNEDRTLTFNGGARNISVTEDSANTLEYRINSGSWVTYSGAFAVTSGQTLGWRVSGTTTEIASVTVKDDSRAGATVGTFGILIV